MIFQVWKVYCSIKTITVKQKNELEVILQASLKIRDWAENELKPLRERVVGIVREEGDGDYSWDFVMNGEDDGWALNSLLGGLSIKVEDDSDPR